MTIPSGKYPADWIALKHPDKRAQLISYLSEIIASNPHSSPTYDQFDIDESVHFFFDDTDLSSSDEGEIGYALFDENEAVAVHGVTDALDDLISELGNVETVKFLAHPRWPDVKRAAKAALEVIAQRGKPNL